MLRERASLVVTGVLDSVCGTLRGSQRPSRLKILL